MVRIFIADDHGMVRRGLKSIIELRPDFSLVGEAEDGQQAVQMCERLRPNIAVLDHAMPKLNGLEATRQIRAKLPQTEVIMLTMHDSEELARQVLAAGARGFLLKSDAITLLEQAIDQVHQQMPFFTGRVSEILLRDHLNNDHVAANALAGSELTAREREIVQLIAEGLSTKEIANQLTISVKTAETHRTNLMRKIKARSVSEIVLYAVRNHIIKP